MPFEVAPQIEQQTREQLGRIALEAIAAHILTVAPERFDVALWCGTACCAVGNSINLPAVRMTGLYLDWIKNPEPWDRNTHMPAFDGRTGHHRSIAEAFAIPERVSRELFGGQRLTTPAEISAGIRAYLATGSVH